MRDERLEWASCIDCDGAYTWFNIEVMDEVNLYGWVHLWIDGPRCSRDKGMTLQDMRFSTD